MSITIQIANVTSRAIVVAVDVGIHGATVSGSVIIVYSGESFRLQKSSSEQHDMLVGFKCGTRFPLHCMKPDSSGGRQPKVLKECQKDILRIREKRK